MHEALLKEEQTVGKRSCTKVKNRHVNQSVNNDGHPHLQIRYMAMRKMSVSRTAQVGYNVDESADSEVVTVIIGDSTLRASETDRQWSRLKRLLAAKS